MSPALQSLVGQQLRSVDPAGGDGLLVLTSSSPGSEQLGLLESPGTQWHLLTQPPAGTATVAFGPAGGATDPDTAQAMVADHTVLTVRTPEAASRGVRGQPIRVPIQFGSST